jgi:hypothetical protein
MRTLDDIRTVWERIIDRFAALQRLSRFTCGDCACNERCDHAPDPDCDARALQIAREGEERPRRRAGFPAVWPH